MSSLMSKMSPVAVQQQLRRVTVNQAVNARAHSSFYPKARDDKRLPVAHRSLNTTKHLNTAHDESTIDFAYMPQDVLAPPSQPETFRVPLLPDNVTPPIEYTNNAHRDIHLESVVRPTISTTSANGTHIESPSAFSDVTDNHAVDMDVFDLTKKVTSAAASKVTEMTTLGAKEVERQRGVLGEIFSGMVDDVFGSKRPAKA